MNAQEFMAQHYEDGEVYGEGVTLYKEYDDEVYHKTVSQISVYQAGEQYFEVEHTRDNCGYWGDGERYDPTCREVKPVKKMVEITEWVGV